MRKYLCQNGGGERRSSTKLLNVLKCQLMFYRNRCHLRWRSSSDNSTPSTHESVTEKGGNGFWAKQIIMSIEEIQRLINIRSLAWVNLQSFTPFRVSSMRNFSSKSSVYDDNWSKGEEIRDLKKIELNVMTSHRWNPLGEVASAARSTSNRMTFWHFSNVKISHSIGIERTWCSPLDLSQFNSGSRSLIFERFINCYT